MHIVGDVSESSTQEALQSLAEKWTAKTVAIPALPALNIPDQSTVFFYDVPDAKQSHLRLGYPSLSSMNKDYFPAQVMNYLLGASGFASRLTQELREAKGYTYHADSEFQGGLNKGPFLIYCSVRSNVTLESLEVIKQILETYGESFSNEDLTTTKSSMVKGNARAFETARAKLRMLENISTYDWPTNYVLQQSKVVENMTLEEIKSLAKNYLKSDQMIWLVVGDAKTQMDRLEALNFGTPILLNEKKPLTMNSK